MTVSRKRTASPAKGGRAPHARADPDSAAAATAPAATPGMRVSGFFGVSWDPGTIQVVHADGAFDVEYDDGLPEYDVRWGNDLRPLLPSLGAALSADPASLASLAESPGATQAAAVAVAAAAPAPPLLPPAAAATPTAAGAAPPAPSKAAAGLQAVLGVDSLCCPQCASEFLKPDEYVRHVDSCCPGLSATDLASAGLVRCPAHGCGELRGLIAPSPGSRSDYYRHVQVASKSGELVCAHKRLVESDGGNYSRVDFTAAARAKAVARPGSYGAALQTSAKAPATQQGGAVAAMRAARAAAAAKARSMDGIDQYQPNSGFDLSVMEQTDGAGQLLIDPELIKSRTLLMQSLPKSVEVRVALLQPLVHGECVYGATNESTATQAGANGLSYYYACMAIILLRAPGTDARDEGEMLERAARCARDPEELLEAWRRWLRETAPSADPSASLDQPELPPPSAADADLKSAQRFQYYMSHENEGKAFQAMGAVGGLKNTACPAVAAGYAALCPQRPGPSAAATCDVPGQAPFKLKAAVYDQFFSGLKTCKAPGPLYETNELMQAVAEAGAYECMRRSTTTSCAGRVHPRVVTLLASLRGLVVGKDDGSDRPLGLGECRRRLWFGCAMAQKKPELEHFYTNPLPADAAARASELRAAEQQAGQAAAAQTAAARGQQSELFDRTTQDVVAADARLAAARAPVNFPVNFAYSRSGCELLNHTLDAWMENEPLEHQLSDDKTNMYNETVSEASFNGLREHDPDLVPLYRLFYGAPAPIYFCREKGPLRVAHLHDGDSCDEVVQALTRREAIPLGTDLRDADLWMNCTGGHQGCPGATHFACLPYHLSLHARNAEELPRPQDRLRRRRHLPRGPRGGAVPGLRRPAGGHARVVRHALEAGQGGRVHARWQPQRHPARRPRLGILRPSWRFPGAGGGGGGRRGAAREGLQGGRRLQGRRRLVRRAARHPAAAQARAPRSR